MTLNFSFSNSAAKSIDIASVEAKKRSHDYIGPEHLFLGLLTTDGNLVRNFLKHFSIEEKVVLNEIEVITQRGQTPAPVDCRFPYTYQARSVLEFAESEALKQGCTQINPIHLLIGLLSEQQEMLSLPVVFADRLCDIPTVVTQSMKNAGLELDSARKYLRTLDISR